MAYLTALTGLLPKYQLPIDFRLMQGLNRQEEMSKGRLHIYIQRKPFLLSMFSEPINRYRRPYRAPKLPI